jgi:proliferating cell nuclear antigen PCNA
MSLKNKLFYAKTIHVKPIKDIIETLQNVIPETTIIGIKKTSENNEVFYGLEIATADTSNTIFIKLQLKGKEFDEFFCKFDKIEMGISLEYLNIHLKSIDTSNILSLYIDESEKQCLCIQGINIKDDKTTLSKLKLMELYYVPRKTKKIEYDVCIIMKSTEFHKICKEMNALSEYVEIKCTKNILTFTCKGDIGEKEIQYKEKEGGISIEWEEHVKTKIVQTIYELKNFILFGKFAPLSSQIMITMKNDNILTIKYEINTIASIIVALSPVDERNINKNYNYSDDEDVIEIKKNSDDDDDDDENDSNDISIKKKKIINKNKKDTSKNSKGSKTKLIVKK